MRRAAEVVLFLLLGCSAARAQTPEPQALPGGYVVEARRLDSPPVLDGHLDDEAWDQAFLVKGFVQYEPDAAQPATQPTEVRIGYDASRLYFGIRCQDGEPDKIVANVLRRDGDLSYDDAVEIILDTFHDRSNGYLFQVSAAGAMVDGQVRQEGEDVSLDWDGVWEAAALRDAQGWSAEVAIPFRTLRFPGTNSGPQSWGMNIRRHLSRRNEDSFWRPLERADGTFGRYRISRFGDLAGLQGMVSGSRYQAAPYTLLRHRRQDRGDEQGSEGDIGGDMKERLSSDLVADLTVNTDFAESEADLQQINLSRFKLFYPEKRDFFLEGSNLFFFGDRGTAFRDPDYLQLFFSRQIGLAADGTQAIPVLGGAKMTGQLSPGLGFGFLNLTTDEQSYRNAAGLPVVEPRTNYTVLRLKKDFAGGSSFGAIGLNKDSDGPGYNRAAGVDWLLSLAPSLSSSGLLARTETPGIDGGEYAGLADLLYRSKRFRLRTALSNIGEGFNPEMGFTTRTGARKSQTELVVFTHPEWGPVHNLNVVNEFHYVVNPHGDLDTQVWLREVTFANRQRGGLAVLSYDTLEVLRVPFPIHKGVVIPPGEYRYRNLFLGLGTDYSKKVGLTLWYDNGDFYDGTRLRRLVSVIYRPVLGLLTSWNYDRNDVRLPHGDFTTELAWVDATYSFSTRLLVRGLLQWNRDDNFRANVALQWLYGPDSEVFLVYNDAQDLDPLRRDSGFSPVLPGRSITAKMSRRFDF